MVKNNTRIVLLPSPAPTPQAKERRVQNCFPKFETGSGMEWVLRQTTRIPKLHKEPNIVTSWYKELVPVITIEIGMERRKIFIQSKNSEQLDGMGIATKTLDPQKIRTLSGNSVDRY